MSDVVSTPVTITVDGRPVEITPGEVLIEAIARAGTYVPRFCYHPRMEPVGVCRMCLVEVDSPRGPTLQPACFLKATNGLNVVTNSDKVKKAQDGVLEFLLANHPLDCPVCDKGGECPLQDQAMAHGSGETRFIEEKRHFEKPISIGENVLLDRERCIQCSRCTRFASEVAGDPAIAFAGRGDNIEVAPSPTEPFDSIFAGNTVQICPVGALTAKPYRFSARPWDLEQVESTCTVCSVGCRITVQSSQNRVTRVIGVDADAVNHGWLCDKGRFTIEALDGTTDDVHLPTTRITTPMINRDGQLVSVSWSEALAHAATLLGDCAPEAVGFIGGASLTNEGAFAWERFARSVIGTDHLDAQFDDGLDPLLIQALPAATINEMASARVVVTLTGDLREEAPVLYLRLRSAVRKSTSLLEFTTGPSALSALATLALPVRPGDAPSVVSAIFDGVVPTGTLVTESQLQSARELLGDGEGVVVVVSRANAAESSAVVEAAVHRLVAHLPRARFLTNLRRSNGRGALDMGLSPVLQPGRQRAARSGRDTMSQLAAMRDGRQKAVVVLGGCLLGNVIDVEAARDALAKTAVISVTGHGGATLAYADVVLPAAVAHERTGTFTNLEGRVSAVHAKIAPPGAAWPDVDIAAELAEACGQHLGLTSVEHTAATIEEVTGYPALSVLEDQHFDGVVVGSSTMPTARTPMDPVAFPGIRSVDTVGLSTGSGAVASLEPRSLGTATTVTMSDVTLPAFTLPPLNAYALRAVVAKVLYDDGVTISATPALSGVRQATVVRVHPTDLERFAMGDGDQVVLASDHGTTQVTVTGDDRVIRGTVWVSSTTHDETGRRVQAYFVDEAEAVAYVRLGSQ